jgi:hypothetical protein
MNPDEPAAADAHRYRVIADPEIVELAPRDPPGSATGHLDDRSVPVRMKNARFLGSQPSFLTFSGHPPTVAQPAIPINTSPSPPSHNSAPKGARGDGERGAS